MPEEWHNGTLLCRGCKFWSILRLSLSKQFDRGQAKLRVFEIVFEGFGVSKDNTDHLIKWIQADNIEQVHDYIGTRKVQSLHVIDIPLDSPGIDHIIGAANA